jgi:8-oxo-dGTP pyrophosphatase MutT (NUDIX family)
MTNIKSRWKTLKSEIVYETKWFKIRRDEVLNQNGTPITYSYLDLAYPTVLIIAVNTEGKLLLQQNYRYTVGKKLWEFPAGQRDGQSPIDAGKRELMEEAELISDEWTDLGALYSTTGSTNTHRAICLARNARPGEGPRDDEEDITNQTFFSIDEIETMIRDGTVESSGVLAALYLAKLHGL